MTRYCLGHRYVIDTTTGTWRCDCGATGAGTPRPHYVGEPVAFPNDGAIATIHEPAKKETTR